jgi:hypothetical protein
MNIKKFNDFVNESYLSGGRQPIYHYTGRLKQVLESDTLKTSRVARPENTKAICFTRTTYFTHDGYFTNDGIYLTLDYDKLRIDGYNIYPIDELGIAFSQSKGFKGSEYKLGKADIRSIESGKRGPRHNLKLPNPMLEREFEERCYEDIDNLGKYLISINFASGSSAFEINKDILIKYLEKYPHIKINKYDIINRNKLTELDLKRSNPSEITRKVVI